MRLTAQAWLLGKQVRHHPSSHYDARPEGMAIDVLVVHGISLPPNQFGGNYIDALFSGTLEPNIHPYFADIVNSRVSAHALIRRTGEIVQYVSFLDRAWHAGVSQFQGRERCNDFSIGIELEGCESIPYEPIQYLRLAALIRVVQARWPAITADHIVGHCDIAPTRKTDPWASFDWGYLRQLLSI